MHPVLDDILASAGATVEDRMVMEGLARTITEETQDALGTAISCLPPRLHSVAAVYFARCVEAAMVKEYERWKTDDPPEA